MKLKIAVIAMFLAQTSFAQNSTDELNNELSSESINNRVVSSFYSRMNLGVLGGGNASPSFQIINGFVFTQRISAGLGLGCELFSNNIYVPIFLEGNYNFLKSTTSPWVSVMAGYELPVRNLGQNKGGLTVGGKVGFSYFVTKHFGISTSVGYRYGSLRDHTNWQGWDDFVTITEINRFEFRMGLVFK